MVFSSESRSCLLLPTTALLLRALAITGNQNHNDQKNMASCNCPQILEKEMVFTSNKWYVLRSKWPLVVTEHPDDFWELPKVSPCESVSMRYFSVCHPCTAELRTSLKIFLVLNPTVFITVTLTWLHCNIFNECCSKWVATDFCSLLWTSRDNHLGFGVVIHTRVKEQLWTGKMSSLYMDNHLSSFT